MSKQYKIVEVDSPLRIREFLRLPARLYRNEKKYIRPLDQDIEDVFDPKKNKFFRHGEAVRWLLLDENNQAVGRVAAFLDKKTAFNNEQPTGGMGFFECIEDQDAAFMLFDRCKQWLEQIGRAHV